MVNVELFFWTLGGLTLTMEVLAGFDPCVTSTADSSFNTTLGGVLEVNKCAGFWERGAVEDPEDSLPLPPAEYEVVAVMLVDRGAG